MHREGEGGAGEHYVPPQKTSRFLDKNKLLQIVLRKQGSNTFCQTGKLKDAIQDKLQS